jgi:plastocyanin
MGGLAAREGKVHFVIKHLRRVAALLAVVMASGLLIGPMSAQAQSVLRVQVGGFLGSGGAPADGMRFYGGNLRVHDGTTVRFNLAGFHTATLMPANVDGDLWAAQNTGGIDKPFSVASSDPDDSAYKFNNQAIFPSDPTCGTAANPCGYDGSTVVNSGAFVDDPRFSVTIDGSPGDVIHVICLIHPEMRMRIEVVPGGDPETTQEQINARRMRERARDSDSAAALHNKLSKRQSKHVTRNGRVVWDAFAGYDADGFALLANYPRRLVIRKGQRVRWHSSGLIYEDHSVTFPFDKGRKISRSEGGQPACDPDGDAGPGPDNPPELEGPPFCNDPSQFEFDISARFAEMRGDNRHGLKDFDSSGLFGNINVGKSPYTLRFTKSTSNKGLRYLCVIHGTFMDGRVVVRPRR